MLPAASITTWLAMSVKRVEQGGAEEVCLLGRVVVREVRVVGDGRVDVGADDRKGADQ
jgi:hypothetical protein